MSEPEPGPEEKKTKRILVVDDDDDVSDTVSEMLETAGYEPTSTFSGRNALSMLSGSKFDAVVLDLAMPGTGGISVIQELREAGNDIPIVVLSAYLGMMGKDKIADLGANEVLEKPSNYDELTAAVARALSK